ncbi:MAG: hypothetical protein ACOC71_08550 [Hyphomicrobiales bacterium]
MAHRTPDDERTYWLDDSRNVSRLVWLLVGVCVILAALEFTANRYGPFAIEHVFGFYGIFGFVASLVVVLLTRFLRPLVARREDYYER